MSVSAGRLADPGPAGATASPRGMFVDPSGPGSGAAAGREVSVAERHNFNNSLLTSLPLRSSSLRERHMGPPLAGRSKGCLQKLMGKDPTTLPKMIWGVPPCLSPNCFVTTHDLCSLSMDRNTRPQRLGSRCRPTSKPLTQNTPQNIYIKYLFLLYQADDATGYAARLPHQYLCNDTPSETSSGLILQVARFTLPRTRNIVLLCLTSRGCLTLSTPTHGTRLVILEAMHMPSARKQLLYFSTSANTPPILKNKLLLLFLFPPRKDTGATAAAIRVTTSSVGTKSLRANPGGKASKKARSEGTPASEVAATAAAATAAARVAAEAIAAAESAAAATWRGARWPGLRWRLRPVDSFQSSRPADAGSTGDCNPGGAGVVRSWLEPARRPQRTVCVLLPEDGHLLVPVRLPASHHDAPDPVPPLLWIRPRRLGVPVLEDALVSSTSGRVVGCHSFHRFLAMATASVYIIYYPHFIKPYDYERCLQLTPGLTVHVQNPPPMGLTLAPRLLLRHPKNGEH